jgi:hypothetical protein
MPPPEFFDSRPMLHPNPGTGDCAYAYDTWTDLWGSSLPLQMGSDFRINMQFSNSNTIGQELGPR